MNIKKTITGLAIAATATGIVVPITSSMSSASNVPDGINLNTSSVQRDAQYVIKCASELWTGCTKWDASIARVERATRKAALATGNCKSKKGFHGWRAGFCEMNEDDTSNVNIYRSNLGIVARASLLLK
jgi:hypothetical protein